MTLTARGSSIYFHVFSKSITICKITLQYFTIRANLYKMLLSS